METYLFEWANLILRWLHIIAGITWIGTSFHFIWLDNSLTLSTEGESKASELGHLWLIHSGGFYEVTKYRLLPETMVDNLHWFKWEAYFTWLSGIALLTVIYYIDANYFLIDQRVADLSQWQAIGIGLGFLAGGWFFYDLLCNAHLAKNNYVLAVLLLISVLVAAWALTQIFSTQGAFIHVGAMIGTIMAANVFMVIIPAQKALVTAVTDGRTPDINLATKAKLRSTHNYYATLPLLLIMISNHYPIVYMHKYNWLVLTAIIAFTVSIQHYFILKHQSIHNSGKE